MTVRAEPKHIAIIMDGNRRWAAAQGRPDHAGHHQGTGIVEEIAEAAHGEGVLWLTLFAFSSENWNRSSMEIAALTTVFRRFLHAKADALVEKNIRLRVIGDPGGFAPDIAEGIDDLLERTSRNDGLNLTVALGYGGKSDIADAVRAIGKGIEAGTLKPDDVDEQLIKDHLATAGIPPVDLLVRTGREKRVSNFLLWDIAYSELVFTDTLWPDFGAAELQRILSEYRQRDRRFGGDPVVEAMATAMAPDKRIIGQA